MKVRKGLGVCILAVLIVTTLLPVAAEGQPGRVYRIATRADETLTYTEVRPTIGDIYWHGSTDSWYVVVQVVGGTAIVVPQGQEWRFFVMNYVRVAVVVVLLALGTLWLKRRKSRA